MSIDLEKLKLICGLATPPPWSVEVLDLDSGASQVPEMLTVNCGSAGDFASVENSEFVVAARTAMPKLIAELEETGRWLEDRWNESTDFGMKLVKENERLQRAEKELTEAKTFLSDPNGKPYYDGETLWEQIKNLYSERDEFEEGMERLERSCKDWEEEARIYREIGNSQFAMRVEAKEKLRQAEEQLTAAENRILSLSEAHEKVFIQHQKAEERIQELAPRLEEADRRTRSQQEELNQSRRDIKTVIVATRAEAFEEILSWPKIHYSEFFELREWLRQKAAEIKKEVA